MKQLPKVIYLNRENEDGPAEDQFLSVSENLQDKIVETGKRMRVGEYVLKSEYEVATETTIVAEVGS